MNSPLHVDVGSAVSYTLGVSSHETGGLEKGCTVSRGEAVVVISEGALNKSSAVGEGKLHLNSNTV
jgi:hypothetical protein